MTFTSISLLQLSGQTTIRKEVLPNGSVYIVTQINPAYTIDSAKYAIFIPEGIKLIKGVFIHQHGCTMEGRGIATAYDVQYQSFAKKWQLAILGPDLYSKNNCHDWKNPESGSAKALFTTLSQVSEFTKLRSLKDASWLLWGHSGGSYWAQAMMNTYPERIMALFCYSPGLDQDWDYVEATLKIPVMIRHAGLEGDACCWETAIKTFQQLRNPGGYVSIAYTPYQNHNFSYVRYIAIPFYESIMKQRLPEGNNTAYPFMRAMNPVLAWVGDTTNFNIYKVSEFNGIKRNTSWLSDSLFAIKWREYVITGTVIDRTPPPAPYAVQIVRRHNTLVTVTWKADADIESGISHFNIYKNNQWIARFPASGHYQHFDTNGDDAFPLCLPPLKTDLTVLWNDTAKISITTVNHFGLESLKSFHP